MNLRALALLPLLSCMGIVSGGDFPGKDAAVDDAGPDDAGAPPDAGAVDAGAPDAGVPDAGEPDAGLPDSGVPDAGPRVVPVFVVSGWYGRLVSSCDDGRTWQAHDEPDASVSSEFNEKGLAYADGVFLQLIGWGAECSFKRSEDGVNWEHLSMADVGLPPLHECGGIASTGDAFVMVHAAGNVYLSSDAGRTFTYESMVDNGEYVRDVGGDGPPPGVIGAGGANDPTGVIKNPPHFSLDRGLTWLPATGCSSFNAVSVGQQGGVAYGNNRLLFVGYYGQVCVTSDLQTFEETRIDAGAYGAPLVGRATFAAGRFWVATGPALWSSTDGLNWSVLGLPSGVRITTVGGSDQGTLIGFDGDSSTFYRSTDGVTWVPAQGPGNGPPLGRVVFGYGKPSALCP